MRIPDIVAVCDFGRFSDLLGAMNYRRFGRTGLMVSEVGFGGFPIGGGMWSNVDDASSMAALQRAYDLGVNFFDTADIYGRGHSEELMGRALARVRSHVLIATKVGMDFRFGAFARPNFSPTYIREALGRSLERLGTDYIDLYQLHNPPQKLAKDDSVWQTLEDLRSEGKIRYYGVSALTTNDARAYLRAAESAGDLRRFGDTLQVAYNLLDQSAAAKDVFVDGHRQDWGLISRVPLASGMLSGKYGANHQFPVEDFRAAWSQDRLRETVGRADALSFLARDGRTMGQSAIAFCLAQPAISTVIVGARNAGQVRENVLASDVTLSVNDLARAIALSRSGVSAIEG
jgi:aryl-alcohol dehydrogenase-like predicted oxidoreductase